MNNVRPIGDIIIVERLPAKERTALGIVLPPIAQERPDAGIIRAVGPGKKLPKFRCSHCNHNHEEAVIPMTAKVGDTILFTKFANLPFKHEEKEYVTLHEADVIGIVDEEGAATAFL